MGKVSRRPARRRHPRRSGRSTRSTPGTGGQGRRHARAPAGSTPTRGRGEWARNHVPLPRAVHRRRPGRRVCHGFRQSPVISRHGALAAMCVGRRRRGRRWPRWPPSPRAPRHWRVEGVPDHHRLHRSPPTAWICWRFCRGVVVGGTPGHGPEELAAVGDPEGVVAGTGADDAEGAFRVGQRRDEREGARNFRTG